MYPFFKRFFDIVLSLTLIIVLLPFLIILFIYYCFITKFHPLFLQKRCGKNNKPFICIKFRTMTLSTPEYKAIYDFNRPYDNYLIGSRIARKLGIDELPQLINILIGQMSFIGPRPVIFQEKELINLRTDNGSNRIRPGLSGYAQVHNRSLTDPVEKAKLDNYYCSHMSFCLDVSLIWHSIFRKKSKHN